MKLKELRDIGAKGFGIAGYEALVIGRTGLGELLEDIDLAIANACRADLQGRLLAAIDKVNALEKELKDRVFALETKMQARIDAACNSLDRETRVEGRIQDLEQEVRYLSGLPSGGL